MNFNNFLSKTSLLLLLILGATACSSDDDNSEKELSDAIVISDFQAGANHDEPKSKTGLIGRDIHTEATITSEFMLDRIEVTLEGEQNSETFTYTEGYEGVKGEVTYHEHPVIPEDFAPGIYTLKFTVYDENDNHSTYEIDDFELKAADIEVEWEEIEVEYEGKNILHFEGELTAPGHLDRITVEVHKNDGDYKEEFDLDLKAVNHAHNDDGSVTYKIKEHFTIDGTVKGDYHIHIEYEGDDIPEDEISGGTFVVD